MERITLRAKPLNVYVGGLAECPSATNDVTKRYLANVCVGGLAERP